MNFFGFGTNEIIVVAIILIALLGNKKMTEIARGLGESSKEIKKVKKEFDKAIAEQQDPVAPQSETQKTDTPSEKEHSATKLDQKGGVS